jgi:hypothetical protein
LRTAIRWSLHHPRGPRSGPGYSVPVRHHLIGPIRPTRGHIAISPHGGLYAMPSLCGSAGATRERFRAFAAHSLLACRPLRPPGSPIIDSSRAAMSTWPSPRVDRLGTPKAPAIRFARAMTFVASWFTHLLRPARLLAPRYGSDHLRGQRGLLLPGFQRDEPVAGYDYSSDWTPLLTGLSPARMAASLAAPTPSS